MKNTKQIELNRKEVEAICLLMAWTTNYKIFKKELYPIFNSIWDKFEPSIFDKKIKKFLVEITKGKRQ